MTKTVIKVENLSKQYRLGVFGRDTLRGELQSWWARVRGKDDPNSPLAEESPERIEGDRLWALQNVSFEVKQGEILGIIGRNGAGKSTLLKILTKVTLASSGIVKLKGRVASLLEVGTGFHPELTGRENVYLNGIILGMTKQEINRKFDEIVDFAEIGKFIDTPVKRYSSGMHVRLAFAVAAHLEPEIMLVDEVLAVGDVAFQKKCIGKMGNVAREGRTVLFVSHNMNAIEQLCGSAMLMENGKIKRMGEDVVSIVKDYLCVPENKDFPIEWVNSGGKEYENDYFTPLGFYFSDKEGNRVQMPVRKDADIWVNIEGEVKEVVTDRALLIGYVMYTQDGILLYSSLRSDAAVELWPVIKKGKNVLRSRLPKNFFNEGRYRIELQGGVLSKMFFCDPGKKNPTIFLEVKGGLSHSEYFVDKKSGLIAPVFEWTN
ncbi:MAG: ABC transporter ATP-binding protein [Desulfobacteraceae bacterium]|nr:ABC transporter ATP-binding protein [Desulfobacteraceae bacterium]